MSVKRILALIAALVSVSITDAHRLDEYLQATTLSVEPTRATLQLRLVPGVAVATRVLAFLDTNGDGTITDAEQRAYAAGVGHDLSLTLNGEPIPLQLVTISVPSAETIRQGTGVLLLIFTGKLKTNPFENRLTVENHHLRPMSVYLVNCLVPENPAIEITGQTRNVDQSTYRLTFTVTKSPLHRTARPSGTAQRWPENVPLLKTYFVHGIGHILHGYDHLLFIGALVLVAVSLWELVKVVTIFTLAHTLSLTLAALRVVYLPAQLVEPFIALSIVVVAVQNVGWPSYVHGSMRLVMVFFFGLFHGLGFAGGLLVVMHALPGQLVYWAITGFALGVEAGHQLLVLPLYGGLKLLRRHPWLTTADPEQVSPSWSLQRVGSCVIALAGTYYLWIALAHRL